MYSCTDLDLVSSGAEAITYKAFLWAFVAHADVYAALPLPLLVEATASVGATITTVQKYMQYSIDMDKL